MSEFYDSCLDLFFWNRRDMKYLQWLKKYAGEEWLWHCSVCKDVAITALETCEPHDAATSFPWQDLEPVVCGRCFAAANGFTIHEAA